jgi:outer membrane receptor for ferrienterochelin and colicin
MRQFLVRFVLTATVIVGGVVHASAILFAQEPVPRATEPSAAPQATSPSGTVQGKVTDATTGEPLIGAEVSVPGTAFGALTDVDGKFLLKIPAGSVDLAAIYIGYAKKTVTGVGVTPGETTFQDITMDSEAIVAEEVEVVVTAEEERSSVAGALAYQKRATNVVNGISAEEISRAPDSNAGDAVRRVSSTSLVDGRYVYVRGLGERYSTAQLDGTTLPTPEPEKRVLPMDIFPASIIESLFTVKSYTADLPGDFAGGLVDIQTKDIPEEGFVRFSTSAGYNTNLSDVKIRRYEGGDLDWLGFDDGTRSLDETFPDRIDVGAAPEEVARIHDLFDSDFRTFAEEPDLAYVNKSFSLSAGSPARLFGNDGGYVLGASYGINSNSRFQDDFFPSLATDLFQYDYDSNIGTREVTLGVIGGYSMDLTPTSRISLKTVFTQNAEDEARIVVGPFDQSTSGFAYINRLQFVERTLLNTKLRGEHKTGILGDARIEWDAAYAVAMRDEPDTRESSYLSQNGLAGPFVFNEAGHNFRFFSDLTDDLYQGSVKLSNHMRLFGRDGTLDAGMHGGYRTRDFDARRFAYESPRPEFRQVFPEDLFTSENIAAGNIRFFENTLPSDSYEATERSGAGFASLGLSVANPLLMTAGARVERNETEVESADLHTIGSNALNAQLNTTEVMPTLNLQWQVGENQAVRAVASRTIVRPQFRELAPFRYDTFLESTLGNPFLKNGEVYNFDLRWSIFPTLGEVVSLGGFYKIFNDPIEIVRLPTAGNNVGTPEPYNGSSARNYGVELELRHDFGNLTAALRGLGMSANASLVESTVDQDEDALVYNGSETSNGPDILSADVFTNESRPMHGQSPFLVNTALYYTLEKTGTSATFLYNGVGKRLVEVGTQGFDDTYELARHSFDLAVEQQVSETLNARFTLENITDAEYEFRLGDVTRRRYETGREFTLRLAYSF